MRITYPKVIRESEEELKQLEQQLRGQKTADRVRMLRLLKSGAVKSLKDCAPMVGYSLVQVTRWWERYRGEGLASLTHRYTPTGQRSRLTAEAWAGLLAQMRAGHCLQERQDAVVDHQDTSGQEEDGTTPTQESQCRATGSF